MMSPFVNPQQRAFQKCQRNGEFFEKKFFKNYPCVAPPARISEKKIEDRGRTAADRKTDFSREKARTHIGAFGLKGIYNSIQLI